MNLVVFESKRPQIDWWDWGECMGICCYCCCRCGCVAVVVIFFRSHLIACTLTHTHTTTIFNGILVAFIIVSSTINFSTLQICRVYNLCCLFRIWNEHEMKMYSMRSIHTHVWVSSTYTMWYNVYIYDFDRFRFISSQILCQYQIKEKPKMNSLYFIYIPISVSVSISIFSSISHFMHICVFACMYLRLVEFIIICVLKFVSLLILKSQAYF